MELTAQQIADLAAGTLLAGDSLAVVTSFSIDSRTIETGACFVARRGARDGHDFVAAAFAAGARVALVDRADFDAAAALRAGGPDAAVVLVSDALEALGAVAAGVRESLAALVVGVTGSAGKTATKDLVAAAFAGDRLVHASPGSFNNEAGVPLTILGADPAIAVLVLEMGARSAGHIAELCRIARPSAGIITNIGLAHAEHFGDRAGVAAAKGELLDALPPAGLAILNADDDTTPGLAKRTEAAVLLVGRTGDVRIRDVRLDADLRPRFHLDSPWGSAEVELALRGEHQATNAAMGAAVALAHGTPLDVVVAGLAGVTSAPWRMELLRTAGGVTVLNDAYNASPASMAAALESLRRLPATRRIAVLGDMRELGTHTVEAHAELGRQAAAAGVDLLVLVGADAAAAADAATAGGVTVVTAPDANAAGVELAGVVRPGDAVLLKASRAVGLESLASDLVRGAAGLGESGPDNSDQADASGAAA